MVRSVAIDLQQDRIDCGALSTVEERARRGLIRLETFALVLGLGCSRLHRDVIVLTEVSCGSLAL
jgi:hypothetical protein